MPDSLSDWLTHIERLHAQPVALGLERVAEVRRALGAVQSIPLITVGGTNGKGSTCAMIERILLAAGYRTGLYTSPHLLAYNERVRLAGRPADDATLCAAFARVEAARGATALTFFEFGTLAAWEVFRASAVDVAILEVGLGGRLDAVNAFEPDCAAVTTIDIDHAEYLGSSRESIGFEKAGIFRSGKPAIIGDRNAPRSLASHASAIGADLWLHGRDFGYERDPLQWLFWSRGGRKGGLAYPALRGTVQLANASTALAVLESLKDRLPVSMQDVRRGLLEVELAGRFQVLPGRPAVVLDVGHNPQAAAVLADNLGSMAFHPTTWAVFGMLRDKDIDRVVEHMQGRVDAWLVAGLEGPRGASAEALAAVLVRHGETVAATCDSPADAYRSARARAAEDDRIVAFGSFLTVADVMRAIAAEKR